MTKPIGKKEWWRAFPLKQRGELARVFATLPNLPGAWNDTAAQTHEKEGREGEVNSEYARGIACGMEIAAKQLQAALDELGEATPACPHGKPLLATCWDCA